MILITWRRAVSVLCSRAAARSVCRVGMGIVTRIMKTHATVHEIARSKRLTERSTDQLKVTARCFGSRHRRGGVSASSSARAEA